jgi:hypothetical protein
MKKNTNWTIIGALVFGLLAGWLDFNSEEVQLPALMVIAFSFGFSVANPTQAWLIALLLGGGIPVVAFVARQLGLTSAFESTPWYAGIILPLAIAFIAAYAGVLFRWIIRKMASEK